MAPWWYLALIALHASVASTAQPEAPQVPKLIWSFWHDEALVPKAAQLARSTWKHFAPDYKLHFLNLKNYKEYLDPAERDVDPDSFFAMFAFADWLRLSLLASQGGVWIDATLLLTAPLHLLINQTAQISGLHLEAALLEGYFVAAKPQDDFMKSWRDEMRRIGTMSEQPYDNYLTELKTRGIEPLNGHMTECHWRDESPFHQAAHWVLHRAVDAVNLFVGYTNFYLHPCGEHYWMWYYRICVAFNSLVAADGSDITKTGSRFGIHMVDSVQTVNSIAVSKGWNTTRIVDFLITQSSARIDLERIRGIKLRSKERNQLAELAYCETGSIICRLQALAGASFFEERAPTTPSLPTEAAEL